MWGSQEAEKIAFIVREDIGANAMARTPRVGLHVIVLLLGALAIARADDFPNRYIKVIVGPGLKGQ